MKKIKLFLSLFFVVISLTAQEEVLFNIIEEVPVFPGCEKGTKSQKKACLNKSLQKHIQRYFNSELANELGLAPGKKKIHVQFKIDKDGAITDINARAPHPRLKEEAIRAAKKIPAMKPGKQRGKAVRVSYTLPITFNVGGYEELEEVNDTSKIEVVEDEREIEETIIETTSAPAVITPSVKEEVSEEFDIEETIIETTTKEAKTTIDSTENNTINPEKIAKDSTTISINTNFTISSFFKTAYQDNNIQLDLKIDKGRLHVLARRKNNSKLFKISYNNTSIRSSNNTHYNYLQKCGKNSSKQWKSLTKITTNKKYFISPLYCSKINYFKDEQLKVFFNYDEFNQKIKENGITITVPEKIRTKIKREAFK